MVPILSALAITLKTGFPSTPAVKQSLEFCVLYCLTCSWVNEMIIVLSPIVAKFSALRVEIECSISMVMVICVL
jgi:hypothetical protein